MPVEEFLQSNLWWHGPQFLRGNREFKLKNEFNTKVGQKACKIYVVNKNDNYFENYCRTEKLYAFMLMHINL